MPNTKITWPVDRGQYRSDRKPNMKTWTTITITNRKRHKISWQSIGLSYNISYIEFLEDRYQEIYKWCSQQFQPDEWKCFADKKGFTLRFHFKKTSDAVLFRLRWNNVSEDQ